MTRPIALALVLLCSAAVAVTPQTWKHSTEADFSAGEFDSTTVNSRGELGLARQVKVLMSTDEAPPVVSAIVTGKNVVYAASGTSADIYRVTEDKAEKFASLEGTIITSMIAPRADLTGAEDAVLFAAVGGDKCGIYAIDADGKASKIWSDADVKYVWAMLAGPKGVLYAATGAKAKVVAITEDKATVIYEAGELAKNILCLARRVDGRLYAGTDEEGLVVEIDPVKKSSMVIMDAPEKEIASIIPAPGGGLFVATSDAAKASPDGTTEPAGVKNGKSVEAKSAEPAPDPAPAPAPAAKAPAKVASKTPTSQPSPTTAPAKTATTKPADTAKKPAAPFKGKATPAAKMPVASKRRPAAGPVTRPSIRRPRSMSQPRPTSGSSGTGGPGNAVYLIHPNGLVRTIFRKPVTILAMVLRGEELLLGTGNGGAVYSVTLDGDVVTKLADTDAKQITAMSMSADGRLMLATANKGSVAAMSPTLTETGTFTSKALDAEQIALWGALKCRSTTPANTTVTIATRSGNLQKPDDDTWSDWSDEQPLDGGFGQISSPAGRFLQYRLTLKTAGGKSPLVQEVALIRQVGNLAPAISGIKVKATATPQQGQPGNGPKVYRHLLIAAKDPNQDAIQFQIEFRAVGGDTWVQIAEKLNKPMHVWDTRTVGDGAYELKVTASDSPANPPLSALQAARVSEPLVVDNTSPVVSKLGVKTAAGKVAVSGTATDATSRLVDIRYSVDSADEWTTVLVEDGICDSAKEKFAFEISDLKAGAHRIAVKATDLYGNAAYSSTTVTVD